MKVLRRISIAAFLALFAIAAVASAASPKPGGSYSGSVKGTSLPVKLKLKVTSTGKKLKAVIDCGASSNAVFKDVAIAKDGSFHKLGYIGNVPSYIRGSFRSRSKVRGTLSTTVCFIGDDATFTARS